MLNDDDEEEIKETLYWKMKHIPFVGFGTTFAIDQLFLLFSMLAEDDEEVLGKTIEHNIRAVNPIGIVPIVGSELGKDLTEKAVEAFID